MKLDDETKTYFHQTQTILGDIAMIVKPLRKNEFFLNVGDFFLFVLNSYGI